jgi:hypothetical protein
MKELSEALVKFQTEYKQVKFDATVQVRMKTGGTYSFEYATLAHITETLRPLWTKCGLSVIQTFGTEPPALITRLLHKSGEEIISSIPLRLEGSNQEQGAEISYKRRYAIACLLGVVADEDDDSNAAAGNDFQKKNGGKSKEPKKSGMFDDTGSLRPAPKYSEAFLTMEAEMKEIATKEMLALWGKEHKAEIGKLPVNEQNILRKLYKEREGEVE